MTALQFLAFLLRDTRWEMFAVGAALPTFIAALGLTFYPDVYSISRSYAALDASPLSAPALGTFGLLSSSWVLAMIHRPALVWGLYGVLLFLAALAGSSLISVGLSPLTMVYLLFAVCAGYAFGRSGGLPLSRRA